MTLGKVLNLSLVILNRTSLKFLSNFSLISGFPGVKSLFCWGVNLCTLDSLMLHSQIIHFARINFLQKSFAGTELWMPL